MANNRLFTTVYEIVFQSNMITKLDEIYEGTSKNTSRASRASNLSLIYSLFLVNFCL